MKRMLWVVRKNSFLIILRAVVALARNKFNLLVNLIRYEYLGSFVGDASNSDFFANAGNSEIFLSGLQARSSRLHPDGRIDGHGNSLSLSKKSAIINRADKSCSQIFDFLGSGEQHLVRADGNEGLPWHLDFVNNHVFPQNKFYGRYKMARYPGGYDIKIPWELSRGQFLVWLGQAYQITQDEKYAIKFVAYVNDWIDSNLWPFGVNWNTSMDVALRAMNWLWAFDYIKSSSACTVDFMEKFVDSLVRHGRHIYSNLENNGTYTNNHYLSNLAGLIYLGIFFLDIEEAEVWLRFATEALWQEIENQVLEDGGSFENSIAYHRFVCELLVFSIAICQRNGIPVPEKVLQKLESMIEMVMKYTKPDGSAPLIGDFDNGRVHRLEVWNDPAREWVDHRELLAVGAVLFDRIDFAIEAGDRWEMAFWLFAERAIEFQIATLKSQQKRKVFASYALSKFGLWVLRHQQNYMAIRAGGTQGIPAHGHNDTHSFELSADGVPWIVDTGSYVYTSNYDARNLHRSTQYHNTICVDEKEIVPLAKHNLFAYWAEVNTHVQEWKEKEDKFILQASHDGYSRLKPSIIHERQFEYDKQGYWIISDRLKGRGNHSYASYFHFDVGVSAQIDGNWVELNHSQDDEMARLSIYVNAPFDFDMALEPIWISKSYGERTASKRLAVYWNEKDSCEVRYILYPSKAFDRHTIIKNMAQAYREYK